MTLCSTFGCVLERFWVFKKFKNFAIIFRGKLSKGAFNELSDILNIHGDKNDDLNLSILKQF